MLYSLPFAVMMIFIMASSSQPAPFKGDKKGDKKDGPPGGPPPRFQLGQLFPPKLRDELNLTKEQEKLIADLEVEVKGKLEKILTADQKQIIEDHKPPKKDDKKGPPKKDD